MLTSKLYSYSKYQAKGRWGAGGLNKYPCLRLIQESQRLLFQRTDSSISRSANSIGLGSLRSKVGGRHHQRYVKNITSSLLPKYIKYVKYIKYKAPSDGITLFPHARLPVKNTQMTPIHKLEKAWNITFQVEEGFLKQYIR